MVHDTDESDMKDAKAYAFAMSVAGLVQRPDSQVEIVKVKDGEYNVEIHSEAQPT